MELQYKKDIKELTFFTVALTTGKLDLTSENKTNIAIVLNVPSDMDISEFFSIIENSIQHIEIARVIKTSFTHNYAILLKFSEKEKMAGFIEIYEGKKYNFMEEETIKIKVVQSWSKEKDEDSEITEDGDDKVRFEFMEKYQKMEIEELLKCSQNMGEIANIEKNGTENERNCPICLESLDTQEISVIIICEHIFHLKCLNQWQDDTCPICRHQQYPFQLIFCSDCDNSESLWACVICGYIACGDEKPLEGHIAKHAMETNHIYSKRITMNSSDSKGIWDHVKKNFIHRLVYNEAQGSVMEKEDNSSLSRGKKNIKIHDSISEMISTQLDSQKEYYKDEIKKIYEEFSFLKENGAERNTLLEKEIEELEEEKKKIDESNQIFYDEKKKLGDEIKKMNLEISQSKKTISDLRKKKKKAIKTQDNGRKEKEEILKSIKKEIKQVISEIKDMEAHIKYSHQAKQVGYDNSSILIMGQGGKKKKKGKDTN